MQTTKFSNMDLSETMKQAVEEIGYEEATPIQALSIPLILEGKDVIGRSQTGTGKTAAFGIPAIEKIDPQNKKALQVLILCPTRELAVQACEEIRKFSKYKHNIKTAAIYGGEQIERQFAALRQGAQIVVGTPGRVMDHMRRNTLKLNRLSMVILDEADEMLSMGFREDIETILKDAPTERQTVLFSATMSKEILALTQKYQRDPQLVKIAKEQVTVPSIDQFYYEIPAGRKIEALSRLLNAFKPKCSMIFCNTKSMVDTLVEELQLRGYSCAGLHGDIRQTVRSQIMNSFKKGKTDILVATDVAARGIDVDGIDSVFNYDIPQDVEYYVHRIGRTGRAGKKGQSFTFVTGRRQMQALYQIQNYTKSPIQQKQVPSAKEIMELRNELLLEEIKRTAHGGGLEPYHRLADALLQEVSTKDALAALLKVSYAKSFGEDTPKEKDDFNFSMEKKKGNGDRSRAPRKERKNPRTKGTAKGMAKNTNPQGATNLSINIGRKRKVSASHILGAVAGESGLPGKTFGRIEVYDYNSLVSVPNEHVNHLLQAMKGCKIKGYKTTTHKV